MKEAFPADVCSLHYLSMLPCALISFFVFCFAAPPNPAFVLGISLRYEGPLTKEGDFGGSQDGTNCHKDWIFNDGVRRRVYLQAGYVVDAGKDVVDRIYRVRNPAPNPPFAPPMGFIGGWVMTRWPEPHPLKKLQRFVHTGPDARQIAWRHGSEDESVDLAGTEWQALPETVPERDVVIGWAGQPMSLSVTDSFVQGRSFTNSNHGDGDNGDTGICLCIAHNGIEMGGGLMHTAFSSELGPVALRRLSLHLDLDESAGSVENEGCQISCPTRDEVVAEPENTRHATWDNSACNSGCTVSPCGNSVLADGNVPCCVNPFPEPTTSRSCQTRRFTEMRATASTVLADDDTDDDGVLTRAEYSYEEVFNVVDADGDGLLDAAELTNFLQMSGNTPSPCSKLDECPVESRRQRGFRFFLNML